MRFERAHYQEWWGRQSICFLMCNGGLAQRHYKIASHLSPHFPLTWQTKICRCTLGHRLAFPILDESICWKYFTLLFISQPLIVCLVISVQSFLWIFSFDLKIRCYLKYMKRANNPNRLKDPTYNQVNQSVKVDLQISKGIFSFRTIHRITMDHIKARETKVTIGLNLISPKYGTRNLTHKLLS